MPKNSFKHVLPLPSIPRSWAIEGDHGIKLSSPNSINKINSRAAGRGQHGSMEQNLVISCSQSVLLHTEN